MSSDVGAAIVCSENFTSAVKEARALIATYNYIFAIIMQ